MNSVYAAALLPLQLHHQVLMGVHGYHSDIQAHTHAACMHSYATHTQCHVSLMWLNCQKRLKTAQKLCACLLVGCRAAGEGGMSRSAQFLRYMIASMEQLRMIKVSTRCTGCQTPAWL